MNHYLYLNDNEKRILTEENLHKQLSANRIVAFRGRYKTVLVGEGLGLRYNASIGLNSPTAYNGEVEKLLMLKKSNSCPDMMMDLSIINIKNPLYLQIEEILGCPVGTIPYYSCFSRKKGIEKSELLDRIQEQAENGISFLTLHLTADLDIATQALSRTVPIISRGGSLLLWDMKLNHRKENILLENIHDILSICKKHGVVISVGTTFRPSTQQDALDDVSNGVQGATSSIKKQVV